ncbi:pyridoxal kinase [Clostridia bacterium]|nr:pyridoxal kinase [Clostridia bacterium]
MSTANPVKRAAAIHDISCFGRCSLTVALPILSAAGIETAVIPTAVLSTHTGGFDGYTFRDLTEDILPIAEHWKKLGLSFDALYTGYLGSFLQLDIVGKVFDMLRGEKTLIMIDPVMADNGQLYAAFSKEFPNGMAQLCRKADIIVPNLTEASLLLSETYEDGPYTRDYIKEKLKKLAELGDSIGTVVLTGVFFKDEPEKLGAAAFDRSTGTYEFSLTDRIPGYYHGTGDVFASVFLAGLMNERGLSVSLKKAVDFTAMSIVRTKEAGTDIRFGVNFEAELGGINS